MAVSAASDYDAFFRNDQMYLDTLDDQARSASPDLDISLRNSDATYLATLIPNEHLPGITMDPGPYDPAHEDSSAAPYVVDLPPPTRVDEDTGRSPQLRGYQLVRFITPDRPQPLTPAISPIMAVDYRHASDCVLIIINDLPWGGSAFMAPSEYDAHIFEGRKLQFWGELRGTWTVKDFTWQRGGLAFIRVDEE